MESPNVIILSGPNGAGKSTMSRLLLPTLDIEHFVNADVIAHGLSAFRSEEWAIKAGKIMLQHLDELAARQLSFAFETTLASKTFASRVADLKKEGYVFHLFYLWLPSADMAIERVRDRVSRGGHDVPAEDIRRRYQRGIHNFFHLYQPLADFWKLYNNTNPENPTLIAEYNDRIEKVHDGALWESIRKDHAS